MRVWGNWLIIAAVTAALGACAFEPSTIKRVPREAGLADGVIQAKAGVGRRGTQAAPAAEAPAEGEEKKAPEDETAALGIDLTNFKERLIGLDSDEINDLLGTPALERAEPPATIWQFRRPLCIVDIFMFDDGAGPTVDHVEVRGTDTSEAVDEKACFAGLVRGSSAGGRPAPQQPVSPAPSTPVERSAPGGDAALEDEPTPDIDIDSDTPAAAPAVAPAAQSGGQNAAPQDAGPSSLPPALREESAPAPAAAPMLKPAIAAEPPVEDDFKPAAVDLPSTLPDDDPSRNNEDLIEE